MSSSASQTVCRICQASGPAAILKTFEWMFGSRESFDYFQCNTCRCLQIVDIPSDLARHYPANYYSQEDTGLSRTLPRWKTALKNAYSRNAVLRPDSLSTRWMRRVLPEPNDHIAHGSYLRHAGLRDTSERILDVGCGASPIRLAAYKRWGFDRVEGVDPFLPKDLVFEGVPVHKRTIAEVQGEFGFIMFHHSLEHVTDPLADLQAAARLLRPGGTCLIRIPVMDSYFWRRFGIHWAELDAPRHLHLMAPETVRYLAEAAGFRIGLTVFDTESWEIAASIRHQQGHALISADGAPGGPLAAFDASTQAGFTRLADDLNRLCAGGRAGYYLVKP